MKKLILIPLCLLLMSSAIAQQDEDFKNKQIRKLLVLTGSGEIGVQIGSNMISNFKKSLPEVPVEFWEEFEKDLKPDELINMVIPIYAKHFSVEEVEAVIRFYDTEVGKKLIKTLPLIVEESQKAGREWAERIAERTLERLRLKGYLDSN